MRIQALWCWLQPKLKWLLAACVAALTLGLLARRKRHEATPISNRDAEALADALRPRLQKRADDARKDAEAYKLEAERLIEHAKREAERVKALPPADVLRETEAYARQVRARRGKGMLALLAFLTLPGLAHAQTALPYQLRDPSTGEQGWYIPADVWQSALADVRELEELSAALPRYRQALAARELEAEELRRWLEFERALSDMSNEKLAVANTRLERAGRWYRSPRFLVPLGVVLGAACVLVPALVVP